MADGNMKTSVLNLIRWFRFTTSQLFQLYRSASPSKVVDLLQNRLFLEFEFLRLHFIQPFYLNFSGDFYQRLTEYHQTTIRYLDIFVIQYLILTIILTGLTILIGYVQIRQQVLVSVSSFQCIPVEIFCQNQYVSALLKHYSRRQ